MTHFGYSFELTSLTLPQAENPVETIDRLRQRLEESLPFVTLDSESARREFLIATLVLALDKVTDSSVGNLLYGAVSIGRIWQFAVLDRQQKKISQDLELYRVPTDVEPLMSSLVAILTNRAL